MRDFWNKNEIKIEINKNGIKQLPFLYDITLTILAKSS